MTNSTVLRSILSTAKHPEPVEVSSGCIYGNIGTGKTQLICSACKYFDPKKVLIATLDQSDETLAKFPELNVIDILSEVNPNIPGRSVTDIMRQIVKEIRGAQRGRYDFFAFDSMSKLVQLLLIELRVDAASMNDEAGRWDDINSQQNYGIAQNRVVEWFWELKRLCVSKGIHFWVVAWEAKVDWRVDEDYPNGYNYFSPQMPPALAATIRQDWSFQGRMDLTRKGSKDIRRITFKSMRMEAKNRVGFPDIVEEPTIEKLLKGRYSKGENNSSNVEE